jgi:hypothetical protein
VQRSIVEWLGAPGSDPSEGLILSPQYAPRGRRVDLVLDINAMRRTLMLT